MRINRVWLFILCSLNLLAFTAGARERALADSLLKVLSSNISLSDSDRYLIYYDIAASSTYPDQVIEYSTKAVELAKNKNLNVLYEAAVLYQGEGFMLKGDLVKALDSFFEAAQLYKEKNSQLGLATAYDFIARAYQQQNNQPLSLLYFEKSIIIFRAENDTTRLATSLLNLGYLYLKAQKPDTALLYTLEAEKLCAMMNFEVGVAYALGNAGLIYATTKNDLLAEKYLNQAIDILTSLGDVYAIAEYKTEIAEIYQNRAEYKKALNYAENGYELAKKHGFKEFIINASHKLATIHAQLQNYSKAYKYQQEYIAYRDSLNNEETIRKMADLRTAYEVAQKQFEIDNLQEDKQQQQYILIALTIIVTLFCILIFVLYLHIKEKQATHKKLSLQKEELELQRNQLEALNNTRNRFFSIISHDLRGPVNAFNGISHLITHYIANNDLKQLTEISKYIDTSASQLSALLDNLLSWSVTQQGEFPYTPERVQLITLTDEVLGIFQTMAHAKKIHLEAFIEEDIELWADSNSLLTILRNLTSNALKFTMDGGTVTISAVIKNEFAEIKIADTGIGMPQERVDSLFTLREEKRTWGTAGEKGLGIGLRLAYDFIEMNKGSMKVSSKEGVGTTFKLLLPVYKQDISSDRRIKYINK